MAVLITRECNEYCALEVKNKEMCEIFCGWTDHFGHDGHSELMAEKYDYYGQPEKAIVCICI